jgi:hypothetical protein
MVSMVARQLLAVFAPGGRSTMTSTPPQPDSPDCVRGRSSPRRLGPGGKRGSGTLLATLATIAVACQIAGAATPASATGFLDDFEGDTPAQPAAALRHWNIVQSVDLLADFASLCRDTSKCVDLVGTSGATSGGIATKRSFAPGSYTVAFQLYGSNRGASSGQGTIDKVRVYFGDRLIYVNNRLPSNFTRFVNIRNVQGPGKLRFVGIGQEIGIGPLVDNVVVLPR